MKIGTLGCIGSLLIAASGMAMAQPATPAPPATKETTPLIKTAFEEDAGGWQGFGDGAKVAVTHDAGKIKTGKGALQFDYAVEKGKIQALSLPTPDGKLTKMKSLRFQVRSDYATVVVVALAEKDGGNYRAVFTVPNAQWQQVELTPDDFMLARDQTDPKDPDGKLDLDKVENIVIADLGVFFSQLDDAGMTALLNVQKGAHSLLVNDFTVSAEPLPGAPPASDRKTLLLDGLSHPQVGWMGLGGTGLSATKGKPLDGTSLKAAYHQAPGKVTGFLRGVSTGQLAGKTQIEFTVASEKPAKLLLQVEETSGGKYNAVVDVPGGKEMTDITQAFADFKPSDDSKDDNGKLDLDQVKTLLILDLSGLLDMADTDNTLWIGKLRATTK